MIRTQEALQLLPLINNLEAYEAFVKLLDGLHSKYYALLRDSTDQTDTFRNQGKLQLVDELKELRERIKDRLKEAKDFNIPLSL